MTGVQTCALPICKVDGAEILRRVEQHGVTVMCAAPAVANAILDAAANWDGPIPGRDRVRIVCAGAPPPTKTIERIETELGWEFIQIYGLTETTPLLTMNRDREEYDHLSAAERAARLSRAGVPALGVEVRTNVHVQDIRAGEVVVAGETIRAGSIIWAAGVGAVPLTRTLGVETDRAGRLKVLPDLSLPGHPEVFAAGDLVSLVDPNAVTVPGVAQGAMQAGAHAAKLIAAELAAGGGPKAGRPAFAYVDKGNMATIGRSAAVAQIGKVHFSGYPAWIAWLALHLVFLVGFRNRLSVLLQWTYSYFTYKRGARIITGVSGEKSAGSA